MIDQFKRVSTADFNSLVEARRANIIAYAMMLSAGTRDRDSMILMATTAIWKVRKNYHPSSGVGFDEWCFKQISNAYCLASNKLGVGRDLEVLVKSEAAAFLPEKEMRMAAFDRAFFGLSHSQKKRLSISCQHPRLQEKYINDQKGLNRETFEEQLIDLKFTLLAQCSWKGTSNDHGGVASSDRLLMLHLAAGALSSDVMATCHEKLVNDPVLRKYYYSCVSLQQALITRLQDEPSAELREGDDFSDEKRKRKRLILIALFAFLLPVLYSSTKDDGYFNKGVNKVVYSVVPEPSSISLLGVGLSMLLMRRCRDTPS